MEFDDETDLPEFPETDFTEEKALPEESASLGGIDRPEEYDCWGTGTDPVLYRSGLAVFRLLSGAIVGLKN